VTTAQLVQAGLSHDGIAQRVKREVLHRRHRGVPRVEVHYSRRLGPLDVVTFHGIPLTNVARLREAIDLYLNGTAGLKSLARRHSSRSCKRRGLPNRG
jgi:hypothetical protein